jgi:DNA-binding transcriptional LysR family regulator
VDFRQFRYFVTVAEELHMARAAERLGIAQPALSQQIKVIEQQIGTQLFDRSNRRLTLTETGEAFLEGARRALEQANFALSVARGIACGEAGQIRIGYVGSAMVHRDFPRFLADFRADFPNVELTFRVMTVAEQVAALLASEIDVAVVRDAVPDAPRTLLARRLVGERLIVALPEGHAAAARDAVDLADLASEAFLFPSDPPGYGLTQSILDVCQTAGFQPRIDMRVLDLCSIVGLVVAGCGVAVLPECLESLNVPGIRYRPLTDERALSELRIMVRQSDRSNCLRHFVARVREMASNLETRTT